MVPRLRGGWRFITSILLFGIAIYAAVYGVTYAYMLHHLVNIVAAWLVAIHSSDAPWNLAGLRGMFEGDTTTETRKRGKTP